MEFVGEERKDSMSSVVNSSSIDVNQFLRTPFYCEENVYLLIKELCKTGVADATGSDLFAVFISNEHKQVPLWNQKASKRADGIVLWDYHVICIQVKQNCESSALVWDLDSTLPFPSPLALYASKTIYSSFQLFTEFKRFFRVVHAPLFLRYFASDRRHMKDSAGNWTAQPPPYEPIVSYDGTLHNLNEYMDIGATDLLPNVENDVISNVFKKNNGVVITEAQLEEFFRKIPELLEHQGVST